MHLLKNYQRRLINLGTGNRSLLLLRLSAGLHLDFQELDFLNGKPAFDTLANFIAGGRKVNFCQVADSRHAPTNAISQRLKAISRQADLIREEQGAEALFIGWPFVQGRFADGTLVRCPLLFFPVQLAKLNNQWQLQHREGADVQFNTSLLLAYAHYNQTAADENLLEFTLPEPSAKQDIRDVLLQLYNLLKESSLQINFNQDLFLQKIAPFRHFLKAAFEQEFQPGQLKLFPEAVLGIFPQAGSYLLTDYDYLLQQPHLQSPEDLFFGPADHKPVAADRNLNFTLFDVDASQEVVLEEVKKGRSVVVQGPPGSGKSQLICNLVSDFTSRGKTVLVVSQKRAALEVVQQRLASAGMANFTALIHDVKTDRKRLFGQLQRQIERVEEYRKENVAFANIYAERQYLETGKQLHQALQTFDEFRSALFDTSLCGWSVKELYLKSSPHQPYLNLGPLYKNFTAATLPDFEPRLKKHLEKAAFFEAEDFILKDRRNFKNWNWQQQPEMQKAIAEIPQFLQNIAAELPVSAGSGASVLHQLLTFAAAEKELQQLISFSEPGLDTELLGQVVQSKVSVRNLISQTRKLAEQIKELPAYFLQETSSAIQQLSAALHRYEQLKGNLLGKVKWQLLYPEKKIVAASLAENNLPDTDAARLQLKQQSTARLSIDKKIAALQEQLPALKNIRNPADFLKADQAVILSGEVALLLNNLAKKGVLPKACRKPFNWLQLVSEVKKQLSVQQQFQQKYTAWLHHLTQDQVKKIAGNEAFQKALLVAVSEHLEALIAFDSEEARFSGSEVELVKALRHESPEPEQQLALFRNSLWLAWITAIETRFPVLRQASDGRLQELQQALPALLQKQKELVFPMVHSRLREPTYHNLTYNRLGNPVTYRRLYADVTRKRNLPPLRKLFSLHHPEIANLIPCWLASPEMVSAVFPPDKAIDLIIFDEASQCFAELGLPAIYRAKQVVIAGDKQQLSPTDLYRTRWQQEPSETEEIVAESLLDFGSLHLPQYLLTGHYRSRFPELIEFSNRHFYHGKLQLIPDRQTFYERPPAVKFCHVNGRWQNNTNEPEARAVVQQALQLLQQGQGDIGIITFNYPQQILVRDLLEAALQQENQPMPESLFIKNIENVQGDEKEIIIISVGYAPDAAGLVQAHFGSLNLQGGSNRLNVVVTRAKAMQYIFTSLMPEQLQVEKTRHAGPKLLKMYLQYARQVSGSGFRYQLPATVPQKQEFWLSDRLVTEAQHPGSIISLRKELPFADITVLQDQQYQGVVLTDDALYHSYQSVRQAHIDVPARLQAHGWPFVQLFSRQYWQNPDTVFSMIRKHDA